MLLTASPPNPLNNNITYKSYFNGNYVESMFIEGCLETQELQEQELQEPGQELQELQELQDFQEQHRMPNYNGLKTIQQSQQRRHK